MTQCAAWVPERDAPCALPAAMRADGHWFCWPHFLGWTGRYRPSLATLTAALGPRLPSAGSPPPAGAGVDTPPPLESCTGGVA